MDVDQTARRRLSTADLPLLLILSAAAGLRIVFLTHPLRYDEALTFVGYAAHPLSFALTTYSAPNNHLFHTLLVHLTTLFGTQYNEVLIRLPAFAAGMALIPATYALGHRLHRHEVGLIAAALAAVSPPLIEYATNARGYSLVALCFVLLWLVATDLIRQPRARSWFWFVVIAVIGLYTIPTMLYGFAVVVVWLALSRRDRLRPLLIACGVTAAITLLLYLPVFLVSGIDAVVANQFVAPLPANGFGEALWRSLVTTGETWTRYQPPLITVVLIVGLLVALVFQRRAAVYPIPALAVALIVCGAMVLVQRVAPYPRVWLFLLPITLISGAAGWVSVLRLKPRGAAALAFALCLILSVNLPFQSGINPLDEAGTEYNAEDTALFVKAFVQNDPRSVEVLPVSETLLFYFRKHGVPTSLFPQRLDQLDADVLLIMVNTTQYSIERLTDLLRQYGADFSAYGDPQLVQTYPYAQVYLLRHK